MQLRSSKSAHALTDQNINILKGESSKSKKSTQKLSSSSSKNRSRSADTRSKAPLVSQPGLADCSIVSGSSTTGSRYKKKKNKHPLVVKQSSNYTNIYNGKNNQVVLSPLHQTSLNGKPNFLTIWNIDNFFSIALLKLFVAWGQFSTSFNSCKPFHLIL